MRRELKNPLGTLIKGSPIQTMQQLKQLILKEKPPETISIGDIVTKNMTKNRIPVQIMITDNKVLRENFQPKRIDAHKTLHVKNPAGMITPEAWATVQNALPQEQTTSVLVDGEEDLFVLVAVSLAPIGSLVVYGQPYEGIVAVKVTKETKKKVQFIIDAMQPIVEKPK